MVTKVAPTSHPDGRIAGEAPPLPEWPDTMVGVELADVPDPVVEGGIGDCVPFDLNSISQAISHA